MILLKIEESCYVQRIYFFGSLRKYLAFLAWDFDAAMYKLTYTYKLQVCYNLFIFITFFTSFFYYLCSSVDIIWSINCVN